jgi:ABC-type transport system involved in Fe-S cluster assembly fused permease/ATPase subunit
VSFAYGDKGEVLHDVSFHVQSGRDRRHRRPSGSGKTTLVGLVPRFYDVQQGAVLLDGVDVREYRLTDLRSQVSLVSQDVFCSTTPSATTSPSTPSTRPMPKSRRRRAPPTSWNSSRSSRRVSIRR